MVLHTTPNGYIVVKLDDPDNVPPLNVKVYDRDLRPIGTLLDVIGPVKEPYAVVKPSMKEYKAAKGEVLYYKPPKPRRQRAARKGRKQGGPRGRRGAGRERRGRSRR